MSIEISLALQDEDLTVRLPAVPRRGDTIYLDERFYVVTEVSFAVSRGQEGRIDVLADPQPAPAEGNPDDIVALAAQLAPRQREALLGFLRAMLAGT